LGKRAFTILELMVGVALLIIASTVIAWKMQGAIEKKRFQSGVDTLCNGLRVCQKLAVVTQADWVGDLSREGGHWIFQAICEEDPRVKGMAPLRIDVGAIFFNKGELDSFRIHFFSSGEVLPKGTLLMIQKRGDPSSLKKSLKLPQIFYREEGPSALY
jgi:type II secretory pathway pseudopilin PulG